MKTRKKGERSPSAGCEEEGLKPVLLGSAPQKPPKKGVSIRLKLAGYLVGFVGFVLLITWVFQILLLNAFHEQIKKREIRMIGEVISSQMEADTATLTEVCSRYAYDYSVGIVIYSIGEDITKEVAVDPFAGGEAGALISSRNMNQLYRAAEENGGSYLTMILPGGREVKRGLFGGMTEKGNSDRVRGFEQLHLLYLSVNHAVGGDRLIVITSDFVPVQSTVKTLRMQFVWIAAILLIGAAVTLFLLSRRITRPLTAMTKSARRLADGEYDTEFEGKGFRETRELAETLNYAARELKRSDSLQKELIANISHDLRTPLTMIKGYGEVMRDIPGENTPENVQVIIDETQRLSDLVNDLLDLSRIRAGARAPMMSVFSITETVRQTLERYDQLVRHQGFEITFETSGDAMVEADRNMILQVLYNLINNAVNYTGEDKKVFVTQQTGNGRVRISVRDTGEGIDQSEIPLIWDRYYKIDRVHKRAAVGTGLGLSIVREIVRAHPGSSCGINSKKGVGSEFWVEFPTIEQP